MVAVEAAAYLSELARRAHGNLSQAILGYNQFPTYVRPAMAVIGVAAVSAVLTVIASGGCSEGDVGPTPSDAAKRTVLANYLRLCRLATRGSGVPWTVLAAIGSIETDHGRSRASGCAQGSTATAAAPARCSSARATSHPRRGSAPATSASIVNIADALMPWAVTGAVARRRRRPSAVCCRPAPREVES